jgi:predicted phage-related endonuclease
VKTRSHYVAEEWDKGIPSDVKTQVEWQLLVSGLDHIHVIALIGGQRLVEHTHHRADVQLDQLLNQAQLIWDAVLKQTAPELPADLWTDNYLEQLHPDRTGEIEVEPETETTLSAYQVVCDRIKELTDRKAELRTQLVGNLADSDTATMDGRPIYSYKSSTRRAIDTKALLELHPAIANDDRIWTETTSRTLRVIHHKGATQ